MVVCYDVHMTSLLKRPSTWIPIALSAAILVILCMYLAHIIPPDPMGDEGMGAHLFQIWAALEFFSILFFTFKWLPRMPREGVKILILQIALAVIPFGIVFSQRW